MMTPKKLKKRLDRFFAAKKTPFGKISTLDEYLKLPIEQRTTFFGIIYTEPLALEMTEWRKFHKQMRKDFPLCYFFREGGFYKYVTQKIKFLGWDINKYYYKVMRVFNPCHKKARRAIPNEWCDATELLRSVNFTLVEEFWDEELENEVKSGEWDGGENRVDFYIQLRKVIEYIKVGRPNLEKQISGAYPPLELDEEGCPIWGGGSMSDYDKVTEFEKLLEDTDTEMLRWIAENRGFFWT